MEKLIKKRYILSGWSKYKKTKKIKKFYSTSTS